MPNYSVLFPQQLIRLCLKTVAYLSHQMFLVVLKALEDLIHPILVSQNLFHLHEAASGQLGFKQHALLQHHRAKVHKRP